MTQNNRSIGLLAATTVLALWPAMHLVAADRVDELLREAAAAIAAGDTKQALKLADEAAALDDRDARPFAFRATLHAREGRHEAAVDDYTTSLERAPDQAEVLDRRGSELFKLARIDDSIRDFDRAIQLEPKRDRAHWQRGIAYYYAGRFDEGRRQFERYQTVDANDVENIVWRWLCMARSVGVDEARKALLPVMRDSRVPMMEIHALNAGRATPEQVLAAAEAGNPSPAELNTRRFYAHLYLGLYHEGLDEHEEAIKHLERAVSRHKVDHYMWHVGRVHLELSRAKPNPT